MLSCCCYAYNSPSGPLSLETIARRGAAFYAGHMQRQIFNRVWFFDSLDSADDINQLFGYPPGYGRVRWLSQLWPNFSVYPGSHLTLISNGGQMERLQEHL